MGPLETLFRLGVVGDLSDDQLLRRFVSERGGGDQEAFTLLVERHGPMVLRVCREVLGNPHDAQDAFQATFLVLARKAASIRDAAALAGWLHGVAHRIALHARTSAVRRRARELHVGAIGGASSGCDASPEESWAELHEEIARLPRRYREPIVLCYLEGLSTEEAALRIGCPPGTIFSRLSRARDRLRDRLVRRGMAPWPASVAAVSKVFSPAPSRSLLEPTVGGCLVFAGRRATGAALGAAPTALATRLLHAMMVAKWAMLGTVALSCTLAMGGLRVFGPSVGFTESRLPPQSSPDDDQAALKRSVDKIEAEVEDTSRRADDLKREIREIRARLAEIRPTPRPASGSEAVARLAAGLQPPARAVAEFAEVLRRHPPRHSAKDGVRMQLYMMDLVAGGTTLIADEVLPGSSWCGAPKWSHDGKRIVFDTSPGMNFTLSHMMALEVRDGRPSFTDLGKGNCPTFSRDDRRIAFVLNPGAVPDAEAGVWVMNADGSDRRRVGEYGAPFWSDDGREFLLNSFTDPCEATVIHLEAVRAGVLEVPGYRVFSWPRWAGPGRLVACLGTGNEPDRIALLDVRDPTSAKVLEVLWRRGPDLDVYARWPLYSPETGRCFFVGVEEGDRRTLYSVKKGESGRAVRLGPGGLVDKLGGLAFSPDGRYLLYGANRPDRR
jgi:RNA polymerase sigma factor (sigma-70 family)